MKKFVILFAGLLLISFCGFAQVKIGDNFTAVNANSLLELESTNKALLLPRLNQTQIDGMQNVPAGMLVYNSTTNLLNIRSNTGWITLAQAADAASATNPWSTSNTSTGPTTYTYSRVGIDTNQPFGQLANTSVNTIGSDKYGGNPGSLSWASTQLGYVGQIYNGGRDNNFNGLAVKVNSNNATALDVSQGGQGSEGQPLLIVKSTGNVGVRTTNPTEALEVNGNIKYSGNLQMGLVYPYSDNVIAVNTYAAIPVPCPAGTKLIGGGGGQRDFGAAGASLSITYSGPDKDDTNRWLLILANRNSQAITIRTYAICAKVQ
ncbi:hypothetical protein [Spirosoma validum]|uniref:Uncharacterized protein n=1 Tax=Spirosoma validum TaxID=2771355 RepID=A0A927GD17_9BACT|nr:hypothetical protein [Spirosoma validum]MBD2753249.1 hypothetical protein [Spirosoma validum]